MKFARMKRAAYFEFQIDLDQDRDPPALPGGETRRADSGSAQKKRVRRESERFNQRMMREPVRKLQRLSALS